MMGDVYDGQAATTEPTDDGARPLVERTPLPGGARQPLTDAERARLARIFGQTFPDQTLDERDEREQSAITDEYLNENRPPHYDR